MTTSHTHSHLNSAPVAVIDGCNILLTLFRHSVVPPPMATHTLTLPTPVTSVSFAPPPLYDRFLALLADGQLAVFGCKDRDEEKDISKDSHGFRQLAECPKLMGVVSLNVHCVRCVTWWKPDKLLVISNKDGKEVLVELILSLDPVINVAMK